MKKLSSVLLLVVFLIANSHVALNMHWCGGEITHFGVNSHTESKCGCGKQMDAGCCKDVQVKVKLNNNDYQNSISKIIYPKIWNVIALAIPKLQGNFYNYPFISNAFSSYHGPPIKNKAPAYLVNCIFLV